MGEVDPARSPLWKRRSLQRRLETVRVPYRELLDAYFGPDFAIDDELELESRTPSIESQVHWQRAMRQIAQRLYAAGPRVSRVVEMSCLDDLTHPEIAVRLGVTTRTVERCMQRAREVCQPFYQAA